MATTVQQKDTTFTKIFVGGLPYHTTDQSLKEFFETFGDIEEAVVITDRQTGKSRGYGFVTMADRAAAERACKDPNPIIDGRKANVNLAYLGAKPRAFPLALKAGIPGILPGQYTIPQYVYPSSFMSTPSLMPTLAPTSPLSPTAAATANQVFDYAAAGYPTGLPAGYEAATYPYTAAAVSAATGAGAYINPAAAYSYAAVPQPALTAASFAAAAHYQPQQIQERLQ